MYALNFYSPIVADQLRSHRKTATIRLGDKSRKYRKGMVVSVLVGARYSPRDKIFDYRIENLVAWAVTGTDEHGDDHALPVLARLVAQADGGRLAMAPQLVRDDRRVEVERIHRFFLSSHEAARSYSVT